LPPRGESHYYQERANQRRAFSISIKIQGKGHFPERLSEEVKHQRYVQRQRILIHLILNALVAISWVILLEIVGIERNIQGKGNIMPQLLRMMNPKEIRKVLLMKEKIEKNIT
jgi:hypothetical protein